MYIQQLVVLTVSVDLNSTNPDGWNNDSHVLFNSSSKATVWEMSVRDFSIDSSSGVDADKRGTFLGVAQHGTTLNGKGDIKTGIDYLIENKINCVQIMPMFLKVLSLLTHMTVQ